MHDAGREGRRGRRDRLHADGLLFVPAPVVDVVEPVGAGDAFAAGYLFGVLNDVPEERRLRLGHALAAVALTTAGDIGAAPSPSALLADVA